MELYVLLWHVWHCVSKVGVTMRVSRSSIIGTNKIKVPTFLLTTRMTTVGDLYFTTCVLIAMTNVAQWHGNAAKDEEQNPGESRAPCRAQGSIQRLILKPSTLCCALFIYGTLSCAAFCYVMPHHIALCSVVVITLWFAVLWRAMRWYVAVCCAMSWCAEVGFNMICYMIPRCVLCYELRYRATSCYVRSCCDTGWYGMQWRGVICCIVLRVR